MAFGEELEEALATLGDVLADRREHLRVLVIGGSALLLLGLIDRPTADLDIVASFTDAGYQLLEQLPPGVVEAVAEVGRALGLGEQWVNVGPAGLMHLGLPPGLSDRVEVRRFGGLELHIPGRYDFICFKLYAAVDLTERSKHFQDLQALDPTSDELLAAARWTRSHDPSPGYESELRRILALLGLEARDGDL